MLKHHLDHHARFMQQVENSGAYVLPFVAATNPLQPGAKVLEIGCGEGGVLKPFADAGCICTGVDLAAYKIDLGREFLKEDIAAGRITLSVKNIYDEDFREAHTGYFDLILLKDVIEHIPDQLSFLACIKTFLKPGGIIFFGFPPWQMPFGGHQQICEHRLASKLPWYHLLPRPLYAGVLRLFGESSGTVAELLSVKSTGISIERFERIIRKNDLKILKKKHYLFNPIYKYKFGVNAREQARLVSAVPYLRNFVTTCVYYSVG